MANLTHRKRACVVIVDQDFDFGIKLADWLAVHRYQAVLVRSVETAIDECRHLRPQAVFIGLRGAESASPIKVRGLLLAIRATCPGVSVVTMGYRAIGNMIQIATGGGIRHVLVHPLEFSHIGRLLQAELNRVALPVPPSAEPGHSEKWTVENHERQPARHEKATAWIV